MKYYLNKGGVVNLNKGNFKASGGEGSVYVVGDKAYKIYTDPSKMIPYGKIKDLQAIKLPYIISPLDIVKDKSGNMVGYEMRYVDNAYTLAQVFPPVFRDREGMTHDDAFHLVKVMRDGVSHLHNKDILVVDMNELNFLVSGGSSNRFKELYFIDCDSYQTPNFKATAIMENIRDPKVKNNQFTKLSDWFSFAAVSFQMLTGIGPYRGRHPSVKKVTDRKERHISVFNPEVRVPKVAYSVDIIPEVWRDWLKAVLEDGKRIEPPFSDIHQISIVPTISVIPKGSAKIDFNKIYEGKSKIRDGWALFGNKIYRNSDGFIYNNRPIAMPGNLSGAEVGLTQRMSNPVAIAHDNGIVQYKDLSSGKENSQPLNVEQLSSSDGRVYAKIHDHVVELTFRATGNKGINMFSNIVCNVMPRSSKLYSGCIIQNLLGSINVSMLPKSGVNYQIRIPELDGYNIVDAKASKNVLVVFGNKDGKYDRLVFRMDESYSQYDCRVVSGVPLSSVNFICLDKGICVLMNEEEQLELFSISMGSKPIKIIEDDSLSGGMKLHTNGSDVLFFKGKKAYSMKMK